MPSKEDGDPTSADGNIPRKDMESKGVEHVTLADAAALQKVNLWSKGMLAVGLPATSVEEEMLNPTSSTSAC